MSLPHFGVHELGRTGQPHGKDLERCQQPEEHKHGGPFGHCRSPLSDDYAGWRWRLRAAIIK